MKISVKIPNIMYFNDYHEISDFADKFQNLTGVKLKFTEIMNCSDYGYKALFYIGKQDKAYKTMLKSYQESMKKDQCE